MTLHVYKRVKISLRHNCLSLKTVDQSPCPTVIIMQGFVAMDTKYSAGQRVDFIRVTAISNQTQQAAQLTKMTTSPFNCDFHAN